MLQERGGKAHRSQRSGAGFKPLRAAVKRGGGERRRRDRKRPRQVRSEQTSEPLMTCRYSVVVISTTSAGGGSG